VRAGEAQHADACWEDRVLARLGYDVQFVLRPQASAVQSRAQKTTRTIEFDGVERCEPNGLVRGVHARANPHMRVSRGHARFFGPFLPAGGLSLLRRDDACVRGLRAGERERPHSRLN